MFSGSLPPLAKTTLMYGRTIAAAIMIPTSQTGPRPARKIAASRQTVRTPMEIRYLRWRYLMSSDIGRWASVTW